VAYTHIRTDDSADSWNDRDQFEGVQIDELRQLEHLSVQTRNSTYDIVVTDPAAAKVLVRGGAKFPAYTRAHVCGSSIGGTIVKRGAIYPGFRLDLEVDGRHVLTSSVASIDVDPPTPEQ
jgi:hypothetical protein